VRQLGVLSNKLSDNNFGIAVGGGASGSAFGGIGVSNFTVLAVGAVLLAGLTAHILTRQQAQDRVRRVKAHNYAQMEAQADWDAVPYADKRRKSMHYTGHQPPANYDEAANDLFAFTSSITLPDTAIDNADRIKECIHRHNPRIREIMDSVRSGAMNPNDAHHRIHGLAQDITDELGLPHRESINLMPYTIGNID
jgi:hypothetical protein